MLKSRFNKPTITPDLIRRDRIIALLNQNKHRSVTLVSAPAGYGKSIVISQWLEAQTNTYSWLAMDESFNDLVIFLEYFVEAISRVVPRKKEQIIDLVRASQLINTVAVSEKLVNSLNDLSKEIVLVLDDYHFIRSAEVHELMNHFLNHCSSNFHCIIIARRDPPLNLNKRRLYGKLMEIRIKDLVFDIEEFNTLLGKSELTHQQGQDNATVLNWSEGWILGIKMLLTASSVGGVNIGDMDSSSLSQNIDFIFEELTTHLPNEFSIQLLLCSLCNRFDEELLKELFQFYFEKPVDSKVFMQELKRYNLFLVAEDVDQQWYRFHHLFGEMLRKQLLKRVIDIKTCNKLLLFISSWFSNKGFIEEAIEYAIQADQFDAITKIIAAHRFEVYNKGEWWILLSWLNKIPASVKKTNSALMLTELWVLEYTWDRKKADHLLKLLIHFIDKSTDKQELAEYYFHLSFHELSYYANPEKSIEFAKNSKSLFDDSKMLGARREMLLALSAQMLGNTAKALELLDSIESAYRPVEVMHLISYTSRLFVMLLSGRFLSAIDVADRFCYLAKGSASSSEAWSSYLRANVAFQTFDTPDISESINHVLQFENSLDWRAFIDFYAGLVVFQVLSNDLKGAKNTVSIIEKRQQRLKDTSFAAVYDAIQMRFHWLIGNREKSLAWAMSDLSFKLKASDPIFMMEVPELTRIRILIAFGNANQLELGMRMLKNFDTLSKSIHNKYHAIDLVLLFALGHFRSGDRLIVKKHLLQALQLFKVYQISRPFREIVKVVPELFELLDEIPVKLQNVIIKKDDEIEKPPVLQNSNTHASMQLTLREIEVARLTANGLQNKEIADKLNISLLTVKRHLTNIYRKLDVPNRTTMVNKAIALKLFTP